MNHYRAGRYIHRVETIEFLDDGRAAGAREAMDVALKYAEDKFGPNSKEAELIREILEQL